MKNTNYIINGVLGLAVIILFILYFTGGRSSSGADSAQSSVSDSVQARLPIAFIRTDSLLANYKYYKDMMDEHLKNVEKQRAIVASRGQKLQQKAADFQQKAQLNAFLTQARQQQEYESLMKEDQELTALQQRIAAQLDEEQAKMLVQLQDTIQASLKVFNTPQKYQVIFSNVGTGNMFYADDYYDITKDVTDFLNARYVPKNKGNE
ncbi:MAG: OmpH family outer membrane protein [Dysgonamonadaceae bacterium]|jgi:outer membrane protein|nr:OmpH family outer membrane protein [Dysgonamonadaceae bacterium]